MKPQKQNDGQVDPKLIAPAYAPQLKLSANELGRLAMRIQQDFWNALSDHDVRMRRFQRYYQMWRARSDMPPIAEQADSNFRVPILQWQTYSKWSKEMSQLLGEDAEIVAKPIGPSDQKKVRKIGRYMTWLVFDSMRLPNKIATFIFRRIVFGRSFAYCPWERRTFYVPLKDGTRVEQVSYEGPGFQPEWPDDILVPAEDVENVQQFSFVIRKYRATPDDLLEGEMQGKYQGIQQDFQTFVDFASHKQQRDFESENVKREKDYAEGVTYEGSLSGGNTLQIHEWYGRWRMLKGKQDGRENNIDRRESFESDLVVRYVPEMHRVIGVQDLMQMYPRSPDRRPIVESCLVNEGSYWGPSFGELLESIEMELSSNHNLMTEAGGYSVGPVIFYKPGAGFDPKTFEYAPGQAIPTDDPNSVKTVTFTSDLKYPITKEQTMISYAERVTGITDANIGRTQDTPNAPRTARQTLALLSEGDTRAELETNALREDWALILSRFWELTTMFAPENQFFRVTEEAADGLFDVKDGGAWMTSEERGDRYDFDIKFATSALSKESNRQDKLALYQLDLANPLVATNPRALWAVLDGVHRAFGDDNFCDVVPQPPDPGLPVDPTTENAEIQEGQEVHPHPQDNDQLHITVHTLAQDQMVADPEHNEVALNALIHHILEHRDQIVRKQILAALAQQVAAHIQTHVGGGAPGMGNINPQPGYGGGQIAPQGAPAAPPAGGGAIPGLMPPATGGAPPVKPGAPARPRQMR